MLLELKNIQKRFPIKNDFLGRGKEFVRAVNGVDLIVRSQENLSLVGESGCGKTTLARIIMKLYTADQGSIHFEGKEVSRIRGEELKQYRRSVQMVFQDPFNSLDPRFTIYSILKEAIAIDRSFGKDEKKRLSRMQEVLEAVGLKGDILNRFPHEFSGGERQRIAIARALVVGPKLLICDEAVSSLDVIIQKQILELLKKLQEEFKLTYIFISHNLKAVKNISRYIAVMYEGKIVELASAQELFNDPRHPYTQELLSTALHYRSSSRTERIKINAQAALVPCGREHWIIGD